MAINKKRKQILEEENRLKDLLKNADESKRDLVQAMISDAAFCAVEMEDLRDRIMQNGTSVDYQNGENQHGTKQSPDVATYLKLSQRLSVATKVLLDCMPKTKVQAPDDHFEEFIKEREKM